MEKLTGVLLKMFLDRREHRGASEFVFSWRPGKRDYHRFQVGGRDNHFLSNVLLRRGTSDLATFEQVFVYNAFNMRRLPRWQEICASFDGTDEKRRPLILDLGANIGLASLYFSKNWPEAEIIALEPDAGNFRLLLENLEGRPRVHPVFGAVACEDGAVRISNPEGEAWAFRTEVTSAGVEGAIPAWSIKSLTTMPGIASGAVPFIAKIDIESFEEDLFSRNTDWVEAFPIIIIELHDWMDDKRGSSRNFLQTISRYDRDFFFKGENVFSVARTLGC